MKTLAPWIASGLLVLLVLPFALRAEDLSSQLMRATCKLSSSPSGGTAFSLQRPAAEDPQKPQVFLVTAGHVLDNLPGEQATLLWHQKQADGLYKKLPVPVRIRQEGKPLWTRHPSADVAAMQVTLPESAGPAGVPMDLLATDELLQQNEIHAGDAVQCLGFPHQFEENQAGFPVLRSGLISSHSLWPTKTTKSMLVTFNTFEGDSGGPVYMVESNRIVEGNPQPQTVRLILGLVQGQHLLDEDIKTPYEIRKVRHRLGLATVLHAAYIRETLDQIPQAKRD